MLEARDRSKSRSASVIIQNEYADHYSIYCNLHVHPSHTDAIYQDAKHYYYFHFQWIFLGTCFACKFGCRKTCKNEYCNTIICIADVNPQINDAKLCRSSHAIKFTLTTFLNYLIKLVAFEHAHNYSDINI